MHPGTDKDAFYQLIHPLTGNHATITIGASFHPYQLMNEKGKDVWEMTYEVIQANNYCNIEELVKEKMFFHMNPPGPQAFPIVKWEDKRLFHEVNPEFARLVPFVIPYLTINTGQQPLWLDKLHEGIKTKGNAQEFVSSVNEVARFLLPEPTFIIGFDEFHTHNPRPLVSNFVNFLDKHVRHTEL